MTKKPDLKRVEEDEVLPSEPELSDELMEELYDEYDFGDDELFDVDEEGFLKDEDEEDEEI